MPPPTITLLKSCPSSWALVPDLTNDCQFSSLGCNYLVMTFFMISYDDINKVNAKYGAERPEESQKALVSNYRDSRLIQTWRFTLPSSFPYLTIKPKKCMANDIFKKSVVWTAHSQKYFQLHLTILELKFNFRIVIFVLS